MEDSNPLGEFHSLVHIATFQFYAACGRHHTTVAKLKLISLTRQTSIQLLALSVVASTSTSLFKDALLQASAKFLL